MRDLLMTYYRTCKYFSCLHMAFACILMGGISGLTEGLAMTTLLPLIRALLQADTPGPASGWIKTPDFAADHAVYFWVGLFCVLGFASSLLSLYSKHLFLKVRVHIEHRLRSSLSHALADMAWSAYLNIRHGDVGKSVLYDGAQLGFGTASLLQSLGLGLAVLFYFLIGIIVSPTLSALAIAFYILAYLTFKAGERKAKAPADALPAHLSDMSVLATDIFSNLKFFKASGSSKEALSELDNRFANHADALYKSQFVSHTMRFWLEGEAMLLIAIVLAACIGHGFVSISNAMLFLAIFFRLAPRLQGMNESLFHARTMVVWHDVWRIRLQQAQQHPDPPTGKLAPTFQHTLELQSLTFAYPETLRPTLDDISLTIRPGETIAIAGPSGSGKSTLADVISGLLTPQGGDVYLDGVSLSAIDLTQWRRRIGLVLQNSPILHGSVLYNIAWGDPQPNLAKAEAAARKADAWDFIEGMGGLGMMVGECGSKLSGGQQQRLAMARALYRDPCLLILDEPTSALDNDSELRIVNALAAIKGSCAILMITHRDTPLSIADRVMSLESGKLMETRP